MDRIALITTVAGATVALAACTATPIVGTAPGQQPTVAAARPHRPATPQTEVDAAYVARVEENSRLHAMHVTWVNPPLRAREPAGD